MTDLKTELARLSAAATQGEFIVTESGSIVGAVGGCNPLDHQDWHDCHQSEGPDFHFVAETETASHEGDATAAFITALVNAYRSNQLQVVPEGHVVVPREAVEALEQCVERIQWLEDWAQGRRNRLPAYDAALTFGQSALAMIAASEGGTDA